MNQEDLHSLPGFNEERKDRYSHYYYSKMQLEPWTRNGLPTLGFSNTKIKVNSTLNNPSLNRTYDWDVFNKPRVNKVLSIVSAPLTFWSLCVSIIIPSAHIDPLFMIGLIPLFITYGLSHREYELNKEYHETSYYEKRKLSNVYIYKSNLLRNFLTARMTQENNFITSAQEDFIRLINELSINKKNVPFIQEITNYMIHSEFEYNECYEFEINNNLSHDKSDKLLQERVNAVRELCVEYLISPVEYDDSLIERKLLFPKTNTEKELTPRRSDVKTIQNYAKTRKNSQPNLSKHNTLASVSIGNDEISLKKLTTFKPSDFETLNTVEEQLFFIEKQLQVIQKTNNNNATTQTLQRRFSNIKHNYIDQKREYEQAGNVEALEKLSEEAKGMLNYFYDQVREHEENVNELSIMNFQTNWAILRADESSLNIPKPD